MSRALSICRWGLILLVVLMPFHAFLSVWAGHLFGHQAVWQAWKEVVSMLLVGLAGWLLYTQPDLRTQLRQPLFYALAAFSLIAILVTVFAHGELRTVALGLKVDLEYLAVLAVAYLVSDRRFKTFLIKALLGASAVVIGFGLLQIFILKPDFLASFGYGANTIQPYLLVAGRDNFVRILSTLGGPNQLGAFLILPLCLVTGMMIRRRQWWQPVFLIGGLIVEWATFSRSAWIGLAVGIAATVAFELPRKILIPAVSAALVSLVVAGIGLMFWAQRNANVEFYLLHGQTSSASLDSTELHQQALWSGAKQVIEHPLGQGLGSAGPASFNSSHALIPENYYLQIAIETGLIGLVAFLILSLIICFELYKVRDSSGTGPAIIGAIAGLAVVNLFLHGLADSSTAITLGAVSGAVLGSQRGEVT